MTYTRRMYDFLSLLLRERRDYNRSITKPFDRDGDIARRDTTRRDVQYQFDRWKLIQSILMSPRQSV